MTQRQIKNIEMAVNFLQDKEQAGQAGQWMTYRWAVG